jgi:hypothetical protein
MHAHPHPSSSIPYLAPMHDPTSPQHTTSYLHQQGGSYSKTFTTPTLPGTVVAYNFNEKDNIVSNVAANVNIKGNTALSFGTALALGESTLTKVKGVGE